MGDYLVSINLLDHKKDLDKFTICKFCVEKLEECPEQITELVKKIKDSVFINN